MTKPYVRAVRRGATSVVLAIVATLVPSLGPSYAEEATSSPR
ncbi:MAG: hypothetical protein ACRD0N_14260 [Acidimicrobiales bacterium]